MVDILIAAQRNSGNYFFYQHSPTYILCSSGGWVNSNVKSAYVHGFLECALQTTGEKWICMEGSHQ